MSQLSIAQTAPTRTTPAGSDTPIFVQLPQQPPPVLVSGAPQVTATPPVNLPSQRQPAPERFTVWGSVATELYVLPGVNLGVIYRF